MTTLRRDSGGALPRAAPGGLACRARIRSACERSWQCKDCSSSRWRYLESRGRRPHTRNASKHPS